MGTHLRVLSKSYPMNTNMTGLWCFSINFVFLCFGRKCLSIGMVKKCIKWSKILPSFQDKAYDVWPFKCAAEPTPTPTVIGVWKWSVFKWTCIPIEIRVCPASEMSTVNSNKVSMVLYLKLNHDWYITLTHYVHSGQKQPEDFDEVLQAQVKLGNHAKEKCYSEHYQQFSFKYFVKLFLIPKLL